jgi:hypothetical protein
MRWLPENMLGILTVPVFKIIGRSLYQLCIEDGPFLSALEGSKFDLTARVRLGWK